MPKQSQFVPTQQKAAEEIGVDRHTVKEWLSQGAPGKTSKGYDVEALKEWRKLNKRKVGDDWLDQTDIDSDEYAKRILAAKLRKAEGEALKLESEGKIKEHEATKTTEDVVHLDDVKMFLALFFGEARRVFMRIPKEMKNGYPEEMRTDLEEDLEARIMIGLRSMSGYARRVVELRGNDD